MDILDRTFALGMEPLFYTNLTAEPDEPGGRRCWVPRDAIANDGRSGITHRISEAGRRGLPWSTYGFDGWEPWRRGRTGLESGGRYETYAGALAWLEARAKQEAETSISGAFA